MTTAQQLADYWAQQVMMGRGQWQARLSPRGILGVSEIPPKSYLGMVIPQPMEMYDESKQVVFGAARLKEEE